MPVHPTNTSKSGNSALTIDPKRYWHDLLRFWWLFLITVPASLVTVIVMHRYIPSVYSASISLLLEERGEKMPQANMMEGFGLTPGQQNIENQMAILTSWDIVQKTIDQLDFHVSYFAGGRVKNTETYESPNYIVEFDSLHPQLLDIPIQVIHLSDEEYRLKVSTESHQTYIYKTKTTGATQGAINFNQTFRFGEHVQTPWGSFIITNKSRPYNDEYEYYFKFNHPRTMAAQFKSRLRASRTNETSSIIRVSVTGYNAVKNTAFLNQLAKVFIANNLEQKNQIATNTIHFIEEQLLVISDSLTMTGSELSRFRTDNRIQSVSAKADYLFSGLQDTEQEIARLEITRRYYLYLKDYFSTQDFTHEVIAPAMYQTENNLLNEQIRMIMELNSQRLGIQQTYSETLNPANRELENQLKIATETLIKTINSQLMVIQQTMQRLNDTKSANEKELYQLPETERRLLGIERKFELSNEVFTFLLRKRSEAQIQKASNTPDHQVLESSQNQGQIYPNTAGNQKKALMIGLVIPLIFLALKQLLNNKIIDQEDVEHMTSLPIIGHILHNNKEHNSVVQHHPKSIITETFRRVRTRLEFMNQDKPCPIIGVTSSMPSEGKTFCAMNIASAVAMSGKKTAILGFDLRKPGLNKFLKDKTHKGISNYLIGQATYEEILLPSEQENLTIIPTGDIPPNPSELLSSARTKELLDKLQANFDTIILDTPPMGMVSDPYMLARYCDTLIFLVRQNHTIKKIFEYTLRNVKEEGIENVGILINDVNVKKARYSYSYNYGYNYGYGYGYTYGHGYYEE